MTHLSADSEDLDIVVEAFQRASGGQCVNLGRIYSKVGGICRDLDREPLTDWRVRIVIGHHCPQAKWYQGQVARFEKCGHGKYRYKPPPNLEDLLAAFVKQDDGYG